MKKLLFLGLIALQGVSLVAMKEDGTPLEGEAAQHFNDIYKNPRILKGDDARRILVKFPELATAKTEKGFALFAQIARFNNPDLVRAFLEHGATPDAPTDHGTPAKKRVLDSAVQEVFEEYENNPEQFIAKGRAFAAPLNQDRKNAEEESRRKAEEAQKLLEEENRRQAEGAQKLLEEENRRQAEEARKLLEDIKDQQKPKSFLGKHKIPQKAIIAFLLAALGKYAHDNYFRKANKSAEAA